jgi:succinoglycan biosynthesis protein ExoM
LNSLASQRTGGVFTYSVVVADNDAMQSAQPVVAAFSSQSALPVTYCIEPQQNIALARNRAIEHADGDFVVFIDDDEFPTEGWLLNLLKNYLAYVEDDVVKQIKPY